MVTTASLMAIVFICNSIFYQNTATTTKLSILLVNSESLYVLNFTETNAASSTIKNGGPFPRACPKCNIHFNLMDPLKNHMKVKYFGAGKHQNKLQGFLFGYGRVSWLDRKLVWFLTAIKQNQMLKVLQLWRARQEQESSKSCYLLPHVSNVLKVRVCENRQPGDPHLYKIAADTKLTMKSQCFILMYHLVQQDKNTLYLIDKRVFKLCGRISFVVHTQTLL